MNRRRWESNPLETALQAVALPSGSSAVLFLSRQPFLPQRFAALRDCPRQELNLIYDLRRVACCPSHSKDLLNLITPPRNRTSPNCFEGSHASSTLAGHLRCSFKSRRLDSHQHQPVYKTGAFLSRATSALRSNRCSTSVRIRTPCVSFGG